MTNDPRDPFQPASTDSPPLSPVAPVAVRPRRSGGGLLVNVLLALALVVAVGGVAFAAGRATAPAAASAAGRTGFGQGGAGTGPAASGAPGRGQGFGGAFGGTVSVQGTVEAIDGSSMTIKLPSGQTVTIGINGATTYHSQAPAPATDVTSGSTVIVQLAGRGFPGGGPAASGAPAPAASGAPAGGAGTAGSITVVPAGS